MAQHKHQNRAETQDQPTLPAIPMNEAFAIKGLTLYLKPTLQIGIPRYFSAP